MQHGVVVREITHESKRDENEDKCDKRSGNDDNDNDEGKGRKRRSAFVHKMAILGQPISIAVSPDQMYLAVAIDGDDEDTPPASMLAVWTAGHPCKWTTNMVIHSNHH